VSVLIDHGDGRGQMQETDISAETGGRLCRPAWRGLGAALALVVARVVDDHVLEWPRGLRTDSMAEISAPGVSAKVAVC
jgi:hypothetical protein